MITSKKIYIGWIVLIYITCNLVASDENILLEIPHNFFKGILEANYKETPFDEFLPVNSVAIPQPKYPNRKEHPYLLFKHEDLNIIRKRFQREPYRNWAENMIDLAQSYDYNLTSPLLLELRRSNAAKANAFAYFLTSEDLYLETTKLSLLNIGDTFPPTTPEGQETHVGWGDWMRASKALKNFAVAYDLLYWEFNEDERKIIEGQLLNQVEQHHRNFRKIPNSLERNEIASGFGIPQNNHIVEIASGVATACLVLDDRNAKRYFDDAINELQHGLAMIDVDGSYREGAYYGRYVASILFQFTHFLKNATGTNIFTTPRLKKFVRWLIDIEKPDGSVPLFDDAYEQFYLFQPLATGLTEYENELTYLFKQNKEILNKSDLKFVDVFCEHDDRVPPTKPEYDPAIFFPDAGQSIFRGKEELYAFLIGEPGRRNDTHHDHYEPGAFTLSAFNKDYLIDSGYGIRGVNDVNRSWYTSSEAHNIPLVNGLGPNLNPVWGDDLTGEMCDFFDSEQFSAAVVKSNYRKTDITRSVWFANQSYFIVLDEFEATSQKRYSVPWHGLGTLVKRSHTSAKWIQDETCLDLEFMSTDDTEFIFSQKTGLHTKRVFDYEHQIMEAKLPIAEESKLISILIPNQMDQEQIRVTDLEVISEGKVNGRIIEDSNWQDQIVLADSVWQCRSVKSDAEIAVIHKNDFEEIEYFSAKNVTFFEIDNKVIFRAEKPINITLNLADPNWFGYLNPRSETSNSIQFFPMLDQEFITFNNRIVEFNTIETSCEITTSISGIFDFNPSQKRIYSNQKFRPYFPVLQSLEHSLDPQTELRDMDHFEKIQMRNEIVALTGDTVISLADSIMNYPLKNLYGITAGIVNSAWNAEESFIVNLPQSFRLERDIAGKKVAYFEEGRITDKGILTKFHRLEIENTLYFQQENYFKNHYYSSVELNYHNNHLFVDREKYMNDIDYQVAFDRDFENGNLGLQHNIEKAKESRNGIFLQLNTWSSNAIWRQTGSVYDYNFMLSKSSRRFSFNLTSDINSTDNWQDFSFSNSYLISKNILLSTGIRRFGLDNDMNESYNSRLHYYINNFSGSISTNKLPAQNHKFNWHVKHSYKKFRFEHLGEYQNISSGDFKLSCRGKRFSWHDLLIKGKTNQFQLAYNPRKNWSANTGFEFDLDDKDISRLSGGFHLNKYIRMGLDFTHSLNNADEWLGICWILDSNIFKNESVNIYTNTYLNDEKKITNYEVQISQRGHNYSPGIKIKKDQRGFLTGEGYICWEF